MLVLSALHLHLPQTLQAAVMILERWEQPELWNCDVNGHQWELQEYVTGYSGKLQWTCMECEEIYDGDE